MGLKAECCPVGVSRRLSGEPVKRTAPKGCREAASPRAGEYGKVPGSLEIVEKYRNAFNLTFDLAATKQIREYPSRCFGVCSEYYPSDNYAGPMAIFYNTIIVMLKEGNLTKDYIQSLASQDYVVGKNMITKDYGDEYTALNSKVLTLLAITCKAI